LPCLKQAAAVCQACDLWKNATQTVFGDGSPTAKVILVGEQPGDQDDLAGLPFVGRPASFCRKRGGKLKLMPKRSTSRMW
jgi:DNA polymerase